MKLSISLPELEAGILQRKFRKDKISDIHFAALRNEAIGLTSPMPNEGKRISIIIPTKLTELSDGKHSLEFIPIWQRTYIVCHLRSTNLRLIVLELVNSKLEFDGNGYRECQFTTEGDGVGYDTEESAELLLAKLIDSDPVHPLVNSVTSYLSKSVSKLVPAIAV